MNKFEIREQVSDIKCQCRHLEEQIYIEVDRQVRFIGVNCLFRMGAPRFGIGTRVELVNQIRTAIVARFNNNF